MKSKEHRAYRERKRSTSSTANRRKSSPTDILKLTAPSGDELTKKQTRGNSEDRGGSKGNRKSVVIGKKRTEKKEQIDEAEKDRKNRRKSGRGK